VVGDRTGVEGLQEREWRLPIEHLSLAGVFQGKPDLLAVRRCGDVGTEWASLRNSADDLVRERQVMQHLRGAGWVNATGLPDTPRTGSNVSWRVSNAST
jgi:hypothetical protein